MRALALALACALALPAQAQVPSVDGIAGTGDSLGAITRDLRQLNAEISKLRQDLAAQGDTQGFVIGGPAGIARLNAIEGMATRLTARLEALEARVDHMVTGGGNRLADLAFRVCALDAECDPATLDAANPLGSGALPAPDPGVPTGAPEAGPSEPSEQALFTTAKAAYDSGNMGAAINGFSDLTKRYPEGSIAAQAHFWRGEALHSQGDHTNAAHAFLAAFSGAPTGEFAPRAMLRLARELQQLGQKDDACVTLLELGSRFEGSPEAREGQTMATEMGCE